MPFPVTFSYPPREPVTLSTRLELNLSGYELTANSSDFSSPTSADVLISCACLSALSPAIC